MFILLPPLIVLCKIVNHDDKGNLHCTYNNYSSHYYFVEVNYVYSR